MFTNDRENANPQDILSGKPHLLELHGGHRHIQTAVCWDQHNSAIYSIARRKHASVYRFERGMSVSLESELRELFVLRLTSRILY